jgi:hypothetical protein
MSATQSRKEFPIRKLLIQPHPLWRIERPYFSTILIFSAFSALAQSAAVLFKIWEDSHLDPIKSRVPFLQNSSMREIVVLLLQILVFTVSILALFLISNKSVRKIEESNPVKKKFDFSKQKKEKLPYQMRITRTKRRITQKPNHQEL